MTAQNKRHYNVGKTKEDHLKAAQDAGRDQPDFGDEVILGGSGDAPMAGVDPVMVPVESVTVATVTVNNAHPDTEYLDALASVDPPPDEDDDHHAPATGLVTSSVDEDGFWEASRVSSLNCWI